MYGYLHVLKVVQRSSGEKSEKEKTAIGRNEEEFKKKKEEKKK